MIVLCFILGNPHMFYSGEPPQQLHHPTSPPAVPKLPASPLHYLFHGGLPVGVRGPHCVWNYPHAAVCTPHLWRESLCAGVLTRQPTAGHWAAACPQPTHSAGRPAGTDPGSLSGASFTSQTPGSCSPAESFQTGAFWICPHCGPGGLLPPTTLPAVGTGQPLRLLPL